MVGCLLALFSNKIFFALYAITKQEQRKIQNVKKRLTTVNKGLIA
jgi:hypothetical protein